MHFVPDGSYRIPATATEPSCTLAVIGGNRFRPHMMPSTMKQELKQHRSNLAFFHPGQGREMWFPKRVVATLSFSDSRVLVRFKLQGEQSDVLVHIQLCSDYTRRLATTESLVQPSDSGDEVVSWTGVGPEKETGTWKVKHLMRCTKNKVQVRWMGGTTEWVWRAHLSRALRDDVGYLVLRYKEERERGISASHCTMA
jgi:hypothetical protein